MITLYEGKSKKVPGSSSIFFKMDFYDPYVFGFLVQSDGSVYDKVSKTFEFPINHFYFVSDFLLHYGDVTFIPMEDSCRKSDIEFSPKDYKYPPYKHQVEAIAYGLAREKGWLLLDDCGLGKTVSMLYLAEELHKREGLEHCFIVCGVNGLKYTWQDEIHKYSNLDCCILGEKVSRNGKKSIVSVSERLEILKNKIDEFFVITNIETLQSKDFADTFKKSKNKFDMIVLDEAHHAKNPSSQSVRTLMRLKAKRCIALTGTVIMNVPENAYVPLKWTGNTTSNYSDFKHLFNVYGGFGGKQILGFKNLDILQELISSCSLRRLKSQVLDLPPKTYRTEYVEMGKEQKRVYDEVEEGVLSELNLLDHSPSVIEEIAINMRLRQITAFPGSVSTATTQSAKLDRLCELVDDIVAQGDKVVVFGTFKSAVKEAYKRLEKYGAVLCTGDNSDDEINHNKKIFDDDKSGCKVFCATWQKMGTGHTLTSANYLIFIDTPWTRADYDQATDRIYRIGQTKPVFIINLVTKDSYDERVAEIVEQKEALAGFVVDKKTSEKLNMENG